MIFNQTFSVAARKASGFCSITGSRSASYLRTKCPNVSGDIPTLKSVTRAFGTAVSTCYDGFSNTSSKAFTVKLNIGAIATTLAAVAAVTASSNPTDLDANAAMPTSADSETTFVMPDIPNLKTLNTALAQRHERQKVALARLLHEFHQLAEEATRASSTRESDSAGDGSAAASEDKEHQQEDVQDGMSHLQKLGSRTTTDSNQKNSKLISLEVDLSELSKNPQMIWDIIAQIREGALLKREDLKRLTKYAVSLLLKEPTVIDLRGRKDLERITVVGDLHGHYSCLFDVLTLVGDPPKENGEVSEFGTPWDGSGAVIFNGDFVDRGDNSLDVVITLLLLKIAYPNHVLLNRGNHEDGVLSTVYGYSDELKNRYDDNNVDDIWSCLEEFFAALPLAVITETAAIMHGGIPSDGFQLTELSAITPEQRFQHKSILEASGEVGQLIQNVCWSDPRPVLGIHPNEDRGAGVHFGPDVLKRFLTDHGLNFFIRSHEPVDDGYERLNCSDDQSVVTVFSASSYPNGEGFNYGAVIRLSSDGKFEALTFPGESHKRSQADNVAAFGKRTFEALAELINEHRKKLEDEFEYMAFKNSERRRLSRAFTVSEETKATENVEEGSCLITREQWADCMAFALDLPNMDWMSLQPYVAPTVQTGRQKSTQKLVYDDENNDTDVIANSAMKTSAKDDGMIDYRRFLDMHCNVISASDCMGELDPQTMDALLQNHSMLLTVFKFLDTDGNGTVDRGEFRLGMNLLRKRFPENNLQDADEIFDVIDVDGSGEIELEEFEKVFQVVEMPYDVAVFKMFDTDRSGTIDRNEFRDGLKLLNQKLPLHKQIATNADELFDKIDADGSGEISLEELKTVLNGVF